MAQLTFEQGLESLNNQSASTNQNSVTFFSLKNDGDEAIVRFMCDSTTDFEILTIHNVKINGKNRKINCLRDPKESLDKCPLCSSGIDDIRKVQNRFFVKMLVYSVDDSGSMQVVPAVWERSVAVAVTLKSYLDNYGPLSDVICKVIRHGAAGDINTTYEIVPNLSKAIYKDDVYVKDASLFADYSALGTIVIDRPYQDIVTFMNTGKFPATNAPSGTTTNAVPPAAEMTASAPAQRMPWETAGSTTTVERPERYY